MMVEFKSGKATLRPRGAEVDIRAVQARKYSASVTRRRRERSDRRAVLGVFRPAAILDVRYCSATILFTISPIANLTLLTDS